MILFIIYTDAGVGSVWDSPEKAIEALDDLDRSSNARIAVRPINSLHDNDESKAARHELWRLSSNPDRT